ncbi:MAG: hypothetical protein ACI828_002694 [Flavobacteriales bacterium]|jgi:hypothetical protein
MTSGFQGDNGNFDSPGNEENMDPMDDWVRLGLYWLLYPNKTIDYSTRI